jgi:hypothetical protein
MSTTIAAEVAILCAELRARILANELRAMAVALGGGLIDADTAHQHLAEVGALGLVIPSSEIFP